MQQQPEQVIQQLQEKDKFLFEWIGQLEITDELSKRNAENLLASAKFSLKRATDTQKYLLEPVKEQDKRIRGLCKPYIDKLSLAISRIGTVLGDYHTEQQRIAKEEAEYLAAETAAKIEEAKETGEVVDLPVATFQEPAKTSRADLATTSYMEDFDIKVINPDLVPRDLCEPSVTKIRARVKSGVKDIPGVLITAKTIIRTTKAR